MPSSPSPAIMTTLVSSHTMSQLHQSSATLTCSVCDRVKIILKKCVHNVEWCCWETPQLVLHQQCSIANTPHTHPRLCRTIKVVIWHHNTCQLMDFYIASHLWDCFFASSQRLWKIVTTKERPYLRLIGPAQSFSATILLICRSGSDSTTQQWTSMSSHLNIFCRSGSLSTENYKLRFFKDCDQNTTEMCTPALAAS